jgi:hypothetical protein
MDCDSIIGSLSLRISVKLLDCLIIIHTNWIVSSSYTKIIDSLQDGDRIKLKDDDRTYSKHIINTQYININHIINTQYIK